MKVEKIIGEGSESVYAYHFPRDVSDTTWPIKIGRTTGDPEQRIRQQQASMQEEPVIGLICRTSNSFWLEKELHVTFDNQRLETFGVEWFRTNYEAIEHACRVQPRTGPKMIRSARQLGPALRRYRTQRRMTQTDLALATGLRTATISDIENGSRGVKFETLERLMATLDLELTLQPRTKSAYAGSWLEGTQRNS